MADNGILALRLAGPLQSWGTGSRFVRRTTSLEPSKSGIIGLLAAASGRRRTDSIEDLAALRLGVRSDQPGELLRDFQTESRLEQRRGGVERKAMPLSYRYYLADAVYLALVEAPQPLVEALDEAVRRPAFPLFLGRRSCPPAGPVSLGCHRGDIETGLASFAWQATRRHQQRCRAKTVHLGTVRDAREHEPGTEQEHDVPLSFDPRRRLYAWRNVVRGVVELSNIHGVEEPTHDPMPALG